MPFQLPQAVILTVFVLFFCAISQQKNILRIIRSKNEFIVFCVDRPGAAG